MHKKVYIVIIIILVLITVTVFFVYRDRLSSVDDEPTGSTNNQGSGNSSNEIYSDRYLVIGTYSAWVMDSNNEWSRVNSNSNINNAGYLDVFINNQYIGLHRLYSGMYWNLYDENDDYVDYDGSLLALSTDFEAEVPSYEMNSVDVNDLVTISSIVNRNVLVDELSINEKVNIDLDSNGIMDSIINVSNLDSLIDPQTYFNLVYLVLNNENIVLIHENVDVSDILNYPVYNLVSLINLNNESNLSIIIQKGYFSSAGRNGNILYQYENGEYIKTMVD